MLVYLSDRVIKFLLPERYNTIEVNDYAGR